MAGPCCHYVWYSLKCITTECYRKRSGNIYLFAHQWNSFECRSEPGLECRFHSYRWGELQYGKRNDRTYYGKKSHSGDHLGQSCRHFVWHSLRCHTTQCDCQCRGELYVFTGQRHGIKCRSKPGLECQFYSYRRCELQCSEWNDGTDHGKQSHSGDHVGQPGRHYVWYSLRCITTECYRKRSGNIYLFAGQRNSFECRSEPGLDRGFHSYQRCELQCSKRNDCTDYGEQSH